MEFAFFSPPSPLGPFPLSSQLSLPLSSASCSLEPAATREVQVEPEDMLRVDPLDWRPPPHSGEEGRSGWSPSPRWARWTCCSATRLRLRTVADVVVEDEVPAA